MKTTEFSAEDLATLSRLYAARPTLRRMRMLAALRFAGQALAALRSALAELWGALFV